MTIRFIDKADGKSRLKRRGGVAADNPFGPALLKLTAERGLEIELDADDTMRTIKTQITRASKAVGVRVICGVDDSNPNVLIVQLAEDGEKAAGERRTPPPPFSVISSEQRA